METILFILIALNAIALLISLLSRFFKNLRTRAFLYFLIPTSLLFMSFHKAPSVEGDDHGIKSHSREIYKQEEEILNLISLHKEYGQNKELPAGYEIQTLLALSYYPELKQTPIKFINKNIKTTMACQPDIKKILSTGQRSYVILIDTDKNGQGIELSEVPFNAQIGVIGHELAHVIDYEQKNILGLVGTGVGYLFKGYKRELENSVDRHTVKRGLKRQLYDWADFSMNKSAASHEYKAFKRDIYLSPEDIEGLN